MAHGLWVVSNGGIQVQPTGSPGEADSGLLQPKAAAPKPRIG